MEITENLRRLRISLNLSAIKRFAHISLGPREIKSVILLSRPPDDADLILRSTNGRGAWRVRAFRRLNVSLAFRSHGWNNGAIMKRGREREERLVIVVVETISKIKRTNIAFSILLLSGED